MISYWERVAQGRLSRRRTIAGAGGAALGAALLAACGGDESSGDSSGLVTKPVDVTKQAKKGGTLKWYMESEPLSFEPHFTQRGQSWILDNVYSKFLDFKPGHLKPSEFEVDGEAAQSWEMTPDGMQLTMKLRAGMHFAPIAPVNGRVATTEDIAYTWKRWERQGQTRADWFNSLNPQAPFLSLTTPDPQTFVFKLAFPIAGVLAMLANSNKCPWIMPTESEGYDARTTAIGTGPWYLSEYTPSSRFVYKANPGYWNKEQPYIDQMERPIILEYATQLAQFRAGNMYVFEGLRSEDLLATKRDIPELKMYQLPPPRGRQMLAYGWKPDPANKTPFRDERLRQAMSLATDRSGFIDVFYNAAGLEAEGLPVERRWASPSFYGDFEGWWIDPRDKSFGPNGKYFEHNIAEAKALISAAGYPTGVDVVSNWPATGFGPEFARAIEILDGMRSEAGFRFNTYNPNFSGEWPQKYRDSRGNYEGLAWEVNYSMSWDAVERLIVDYHSYEGNVFFPGFDAEGKGNFKGDPVLESMLLNARKQFDTEKRRQDVFEIQRYLAKKQYVMRGPGTSSSFELVWPAVANHNVHQRLLGASRYSLHEWIDEKQAPITRA